jgi:phenylalanyl-tRNA synthetase beta chain
MPTIELKIERLERLVGKKLDIKELEYDLQWISLDLEDVNEEEKKIKVEYNPNRPDFSSPEGIARALKGYYELELGAPTYEIKPGKIELTVDPIVNQVRPYIVCGVIRNIDLDEDEVATLMNIQEDLHWALGRGRKKVAIGVHDLDKVVPPYRYTAVKPDGCKFRPLQLENLVLTPEEILKEHPKGIEYAHILEGKDVYPMIFDKNGDVLSFPPIINGILTMVTDDTKNLFLDITGTDYNAINYTLNILSTALSDMGAEIESVKVIYEEDGKEIITPNLDLKKWTVSMDYINDYIGLNLNQSEMMKCFKKVRLDAQPAKNKGKIDVWVPAYRVDVMHEVDFVEECAIGYGYVNLPITIREGCIGQYHSIPEFSNKLRMIMIGAKYLEVLNFMLTNSTRHYDFMKRKYKMEDHIQIANPVSKEYDTTRTLLLPGLLETLLFNRSEEKPIRIFEVGEVIEFDLNEETGGSQELHLSAVIYHENADFSEIRSLLDHISTSLGITNDIEVKPTSNPTYLQGRTGEILYKGDSIGIIGEIHPEVILNFNLEFPVAALELNINNLPIEKLLK